MNSFSMEDDTCLIDFIDKKTLKKDNTEPKKIFFLLVKCIKKSLIETFEQQNNAALTINCSNLVFSIFWLIYNYSLNPKLTMFMTERSIILYNEYLNISRTYGSDNTNIKDVKHFIINKTIGPIQFSNIKSSNISKDTQLYYFFKKFIINIFQKLESNKNNFKIQYIEEFLEYVCLSLSNIVYKSYHLGFFSIVKKKLNNLLTLDILDFPREINIISICFEILINLDIDFKNVKNKEKLFDNILFFVNSNISIIDNSEDINDFLQNNLSELSFFKKLLKNYKENINNLEIN